MQSNRNSLGTVGFYLGNVNVGSDSDTVSSEKGQVALFAFLLQLYTCNMYMCLSPLLCNLPVRLIGSAGLSSLSVYKLTGYRKIYCPRFCFLYTLAPKDFPVASRMLARVAVLLWTLTLKVMKALYEDILWDLILSVSALFFVLSYQNKGGGCTKPGIPLQLSLSPLLQPFAGVLNCSSTLSNIRGGKQRGEGVRQREFYCLKCR